MGLSIIPDRKFVQVACIYTNSVISDFYQSTVSFPPYRNPYGSSALFISYAIFDGIFHNRLKTQHRNVKIHIPAFFKFIADFELLSESDPFQRHIILHMSKLIRKRYQIFVADGIHISP